MAGSLLPTNYIRQMQGLKWGPNFQPSISAILGLNGSNLPQILGTQATTSGFDNAASTYNNATEAANWNAGGRGLIGSGIQSGMISDALSNLQSSEGTAAAQGTQVAQQARDALTQQILGQIQSLASAKGNALASNQQSAIQQSVANQQRGVLGQELPMINVSGALTNAQWPLISAQNALTQAQWPIIGQQSVLQSLGWPILSQQQNILNQEGSLIGTGANNALISQILGGGLNLFGSGGQNSIANQLNGAFFNPSSITPSLGSSTSYLDPGQIQNQLSLVGANYNP